MLIDGMRFSKCCDYGTGRVGRTVDRHVIFKDPSTSWDTVPGGGSATVLAVKRRLLDFDPVEWTGNGIPALAGGDLTVDSSGNVYYAAAAFIIKYNSSWTSQWVFSTTVFGATATKTRPWVDASGNVWASIAHTSFPTNAQGVVHVNSSGTFQWGVSAQDIDASATSVSALAVTTDGYAYACTNNNFLSRIDPSGSIDWAVDISASARDMAVDADGNVCLVTQTEDSVRCYDTSGSLLWSRAFHTSVSQSTANTLSHAICISHDDQHVIVSGLRDSSIWCIKKIDKDDQSTIWTADLTTYLWAASLASDTSGRIYAACNRNDSGANTFNAQRQYNSAGVSINSDFDDDQQFYVASEPGRYPHFV